MRNIELKINLKLHLVFIYYDNYFLDVSLVVCLC